MPGFGFHRDLRQARTTEREKAKDSEKERARQIRADLEPAESDDEEYWVRQPYSSRCSPLLECDSLKLIPSVCRVL